MQSLGIVYDQEIFTWALVKFQGKQAVIESTGLSQTLSQISVLSENNSVTTVLPAEQVLRKEFIFPKTSSSLLKKALLFQMESSLAFPLEEACFFSQETVLQKEVIISSWISKKSYLQDHINAYRLLGIDPDHIATEQLALARWATFCFPHLNHYAVITKTVAIVMNEGQVIYSVCGQDSKRLTRLVEQKYPQIPILQETHTEEKKFLKNDSSHLFPYALAIGAALEYPLKDICQLVPCLSIKQKKYQSSLLKKYLLTAACFSLIAVIFSLTWITAQKQYFFSLIPKNIPTHQRSYHQVLDLLRSQLAYKSKNLPSPTLFLSPSEVLEKFTALGGDIQITHFTYQLTPISESNNIYQPYITTELTTQDTVPIQSLIEKLKSIPFLIEHNYEPTVCNLSSKTYTISFPLQKFGKLSYKQ